MRHYSIPSLPLCLVDRTAVEATRCPKGMLFLSIMEWELLPRERLSFTSSDTSNNLLERESPCIWNPSVMDSQKIWRGKDTPHLPTSPIHTYITRSPCTAQTQTRRLPSQSIIQAWALTPETHAEVAQIHWEMDIQTRVLAYKQLCISQARRNVFFTPCLLKHWADLLLNKSA